MLATSSMPFVAWTSGSATGSRKSSTGVQNGANWRKPATAERTARIATTPTIDGRSFLAAVRVVLRSELLRGLAAEGEEDHAERVEAGEERAGCSEREQRVAEVARVERVGEDRILREEPRERRHADERERADEERDVRERHQPAQPAHLPQVLLPGQRVDEDPGGEEQQRLEERVREQVEHPRRVGADADGEEHVADLGHRRIRDHALDVRLHERDQPGGDERQRRR